MSSYVDIEQLSAMVRAKRGNNGLRQTAQEIGNISSSTLSRVENGKLPDMDTFLLLCDWLGVDPNRFIISGKSEEPEMETAEIVEAHLRADKELDTDTAEALATMIRAAYKAVRAGKMSQAT
jgi:transcriptional regulator with XRE-family HTH domain